MMPDLTPPTSRPRRWAARVLAAAVTAAAVPVAVLAGVAGTPAGAAPSSCPCSLWSTSTVPTNVEANDPQAAELGVQFESSIPGTIVGVRFYKGPDNTGVHVGSLWSAGGAQLAQATYANETATGWQEVDFATPVPVAANTVYVAGYHTNTGYYSYDAQYFTNSAHTNGPLSAPQSGAATPNGVFTYSPVPVFPTSTFNGNNYWVDVVFAPSPVSVQIGVPKTTVAQTTTEQLSATETFSDGSTTDVTSKVAWSAGNADITVSASGLLTGVAQGASSVTATIDGLSSTTSLTVGPPPLVLTLTEPSLSLPTGIGEQLTLTGTSLGKTTDLTRSATWSSSNPAVLAVSSTGALTGQSRGSAKVTATVNGVQASVTVNVLASVWYVTVSPGSAIVWPGQSVQLSATARLSDGTTFNANPLAHWSLVGLSLFGGSVSPTGVAAAPWLGGITVEASLGSAAGFSTILAL